MTTHAAPVPGAVLAGAPRRDSLRRSARRHRLKVLAFLSPGLIGMAVFFAYPLVANIYFSFTSFDLINPARFVGLDNYRFMVEGDSQIGTAIRNTVWFCVIAVPVQLAFALGVASVLARIKSGAGFYRTLFYLPTLLPPVAATLAFTFILNPGTGPVNAILEALNLPTPLWFNDPAWSKPSLVLLSLWGVGNTIIILLAATLDVPAELEEAAALDGAGAVRRFRHITLPMISPVLLFATIMGVIQSLQIFTQPYVVSTVLGSGSGVSTDSLGYPQNSTLFFTMWLYQQGFRYFNMGYASALSIVMFVVTLAVTLLIIRGTWDRVHTAGS